MSQNAEVAKIASQSSQFIRLEISSSHGSQGEGTNGAPGAARPAHYRTSGHRNCIQLVPTQSCFIKTELDRSFGQPPALRAGQLDVLDGSNNLAISQQRG